MLAVVYGSTLGNTEEVAQKIVQNLGLECDLVNISQTSSQDLNKYDKLIFGASTWNDGELQDDWDSFDFNGLDLNGKTIAFFGLGDGEGYSDTFCDAIGELYTKFTTLGAKVVGQIDTQGYTFNESKAVVNGKFVGLIIDNDNESDKTDDRINNWIKLIKPNFE